MSSPSVPRRHAAAALLLLATAVGAAGCGGDPPSAPAPAATVSLRLARPDVALRVGDTVALVATVRDAEGNVLTDRAVVYRSETPQTAVVVDGRLVAVDAGPARVAAAVEGVGGTLELAIASHPVAVLLVEPRSVDLMVGDSVQLTITMRDAAGRIVRDRAASLPPYVDLPVVLTSGTWLRGVRGGSVGASLSVDQASAPLQVLVRERPLAALRLEPRRAAIEVGRGVPMRLLGETTDGRTLVLGQVPLAIGDSTIVTRSGPADFLGPLAGQFVGLRAGETEVTAAFDGLVATAPITVVEPEASGFDVDVRWVGHPHPAVAASMAGAVARWRRVLPSDLPDRPLVLDAGACYPGADAVDEVVDDFLLWIVVAPYDGTGNLLAEAGPCVVREAGGLPLAGTIRVDAADLRDATEATAWIEGILAHEIGHVLGIGTLWDTHVAGPLGTDPRFVGPAARLASGDAGFLNFERLGVPIETRGGAGTAGSHWHETQVRDELMTGWLHDRQMPLSQLTVGALRDLGYVVRPAGADPLPPPLPSPYPTRTSLPPFLRLESPADAGRPLAERLHRPRFTIGADGVVRPIPR